MKHESRNKTIQRKMKMRTIHLQVPTTVKYVSQHKQGSLKLVNPICVGKGTNLRTAGSPVILYE